MVKVPWQTIAVKLSRYDETTLEQMLDDEIHTHKRASIAKRLHQRLSNLRTMRERAELAERMGL